MTLMHPQVIQNRLKIDSILKKLDPTGEKTKSNEGSDRLFGGAPNDFREEITNLVSNYIAPKEFGKLVKVAFDRAIRYYQRDRLRARDLVNYRRTDSDFYQWMEGSGFTAAFNAPGAPKRTVMFDLSSRFARVYKAGLAVEFTDEVRESMSIDLMREVISKVVDAFDELETSVIIQGLSAAVADGTNFGGVKHNNHVINFNSPDYQTNRPDHDKIVDLIYVLENEGYRADTALMGLDVFYEYMKFDEWKDASNKWSYVTSPRAMMVIEGGSINKPLLPFLGGITRFVISPLAKAGEMVIYDRDEFMDFAERAPLTSEVAPHDGLHDVSLTTYRTRYGIAAKDPVAGVKGVNARAIALPATKFA